MIEGLFLLKELLQENNFMCNIDLKDAYYSLPVSAESQEFISFKWKGQNFEFICLCFRLATPPRIFTKLQNCLNIRLNIFLDNILIMASSIEEMALSRDNVIFLLQGMGFLINIKKSVLQSRQEIQFLRMEMNMTVSHIHIQ